ncbi:MAG TPA: outer membrane beta-barrel protein [Candidatus Acidoferrum sp.]|nr:outer membrane beta-barrel protein [Candidatus Acidoferrum sp.]
MRARTFGKKSVLAAVLIGFCAMGLAKPVHANDEGKKTIPSAKATAGKDEAVAPELTPREKMLLDRIEQLEKRVAELESKDSPEKGASGDSASGTVAATPQPAGATSATPATVAESASSPGAAPSSASATTGTTARDTNIVASSKVLEASKGQTPETKISKSAKQPASDPFAFADFTWLNGNPRTKEAAVDTKFFTPEIRSDVSYIYDFNHPKDDSIGGSSEVFRSQEVQLTQLGVGGDFHYDNVRARLMTQFGMYSETTPRNDASPARGQWNLDTAYRYISEAYGGYHFNVLHGVNVDAGIFMSYIGLFSYYNFDNWAYQPSFVSSNTPWFFNGVRVQIFPTEHLKIEPWFTNGWQSYGRFNNRPGFGVQILYRPNGWLSVLGNEYMLGAETLGVPNRIRYHSDDSLEIKYYDQSGKFADKMAFSLTGDIGCEHGGGVSCATNSKKGPKQDFLGFMLYDRTWFHNDKFALTLGGGRINNPGRYLVLLPPINGATAATGTPYFTENPGDPFKAWDASGTFDYMPSQYITFRWEFDHRAANVPYWSGPGGITPPGGNNTSPSSLACLDGSVAVSGACGSAGLWTPDLKKIENRIDLAILVKF